MIGDNTGEDAGDESVGPTHGEEGGDDNRRAESHYYW